VKESSDGDTLMAAGIYDSRFEEQQKRTHDVQNRFLPWALGGTQRTTGLMVRYEVVKLSRLLSRKGLVR